MLADEHVVGDVEILGAGPLVLHDAPDLLRAGSNQREAAGASDVLPAQQERDARVPNRDALEVVVVRGHQVEDVVVAVAVEDHLAVARALDHDRLVGRAARGEVIRAIEWRAIGSRVRIEPRIVEARVLVDTGVHENRVARLHARRIGDRVIGLIRPQIISTHQAVERRLLHLTFIAGRINVIDVAARSRRRHLARMHRHVLFDGAARAIRIAQHETAFVIGIRLEIEHAAGKHVRRGVVVDRRRAYAVAAAPPPHNR